MTFALGQMIEKHKMNYEVRLGSPSTESIKVIQALNLNEAAEMADRLFPTAAAVFVKERR